MTARLGTALALTAFGVTGAPNLPVPSSTTVTTVATADSLVGLWKATRWFGPHDRGRLVIRRTGASYTADMTGHTLSVRLHDGELSFELPDGRGRFSGRLDTGGAIRGHWYPPPSNAVMVGFRFASPVRLEPEGRDRWAGDVVPFDDVFTLYLLLEKQSGGSHRALLRNPDRDFGTWLGVERLASDGKTVKLFGRRPGQEREREVAGGTYDSERRVITLTFPTRGGSYDFIRDGEDSDFYPRGKRPANYRYQPPLARDDGWPTGTLEAANIDCEAIERFIQMIVETPMDSMTSPQVHGILIARHGKLVLEEYFHGQHRDRLHDTRSAAKSLTSVLIGAALRAGAPLELSSPVYRIMNGGEFPSDLEAGKRAMTLEHLLTMSSGFFCDDQNPEAPGNEERMLDQSEEPDYYRFTLSAPLDRKPGERAVYCSGDPNLALGMLSRATGESPLRTFDRLLGGPMQIHRYAWFLDPADQPYGGGSVQLQPRDFMKLGQLMLNGGTWRGRRILDQQFATRASSRLYPLRRIHYGYLWWSIDYPYGGDTVQAFFAGGAGGQVTMVIPRLDLVVTTLGGNYSAGRTALRIQQELIPRYILPAVRMKGSRKSAIVPADYVTPYGRR